MAVLPRGQRRALRAIPSDFLTGTPSLLTGVARLLDFAGSLDDYGPLTDPDGDALAVYSDWSMVGADLVHAMHNVGGDEPVEAK